MLALRNLMAAALSLAFMGMNVWAQPQAMDPNVKNYKLTMDKVKAYNTVAQKTMALAKTDAAFKASISTIGTKKTLDEMAAAVEGVPKLYAIVKAAGITSREFCIIPFGVMAAGMASAMHNPNIATPENVAFYEKNKAEIDPMAQSWVSDSK